MEIDNRRKSRSIVVSETPAPEADLLSLQNLLSDMALKYRSEHSLPSIDRGGDKIAFKVLVSVLKKEMTERKLIGFASTTSQIKALVKIGLQNREDFFSSALKSLRELKDIEGLERDLAIPREALNSAREELNARYSLPDLPQTKALVSLVEQRKRVLPEVAEKMLILRLGIQKPKDIKKIREKIGIPRTQALVIRSFISSYLSRKMLGREADPIYLTIEDLKSLGAALSQPTNFYGHDVEIMAGELVSITTAPNLVKNFGFQVIEDLRNWGRTNTAKEHLSSNPIVWEKFMQFFRGFAVQPFALKRSFIFSPKLFREGKVADARHLWENAAELGDYLVPNAAQIVLALAALRRFGSKNSKDLNLAMRLTKAQKAWEDFSSVKEKGKPKLKMLIEKRKALSREARGSKVGLKERISLVYVGADVGRAKQMLAHYERILEWERTLEDALQVSEMSEAVEDDLFGNFLVVQREIVANRVGLLSRQLTLGERSLSRPSWVRFPKFAERLKSGVSRMPSAPDYLNKDVVSEELNYVQDRLNFMAKANYDQIFNFFAGILSKDAVLAFLRNWEQNMPVDMTHEKGKNLLGKIRYAKVRITNFEYNDSLARIGSWYVEELTERKGILEKQINLIQERQHYQEIRRNIMTVLEGEVLRDVNEARLKLRKEYEFKSFREIPITIRLSHLPLSLRRRDKRDILVENYLETAKEIVAIANRELGNLPINSPSIERFKEELTKALEQIEGNEKLHPERVARLKKLFGLLRNSYENQLIPWVEAQGVPLKVVMTALEQRVYTLEAYLGYDNAREALEKAQEASRAARQMVQRFEVQKELKEVEVKIRQLRPIVVDPEGVLLRRMKSLRFAIQKDQIFSSN